MKRLLLFCILFSLFANINATHIVGGEFELEHLQDYNYQIRMILYFDQYYGNPLAEDPWAYIGIFRKSDNSLVQTVYLSNRGSEPVNYTNPICVIAKLVTRKILYSANVTLSPHMYDDPGGYYLVWERCCRNNVIDNIFYPEATAQTFYLEFPPVIVNGKQFINSSPTLFPPLSDYACVNREFYADFTGIDKDGDSLVYSLTEPWSGHTSASFPVLGSPMPGPYAVVNWKPGIDMNNMVPGNPSLQISGKGILSVKANMEGLFVFAVKCEEFRDGVKIGEVRRDFQMLVIECHTPGSPPSAMLQVGDNPPTSTIDTIRVSPGNPGCFKMWVTDPDVPETIRFKAVPVNFSGRLNNLFSGVSGVVTDADSPIVVDLCLPECQLTNQRYAVIDLIAMDDECSIPFMDTVRLVIDYIDVINTAPYFSFQEDTVHYTLDHQGVFAIEIEGRDRESPYLFLDWIANNFNAEDYDINIDVLQNEDGVIRFNFTFDADCKTYDFQDREYFQITFLLQDSDPCGNRLTTKLILKLKVNLPRNNAPIIVVDRESNDVQLKIGEVLSFPVTAFDADNDTIYLSAYGADFNFKNLGIVFEPKEGKGSVSSGFSWAPGCDVKINEKSEYKIVFEALDRDMCLSGSTDTVTVFVQLAPPDNQKPLILNQMNNIVNIAIGETLEIDVLATDADGDNIFLDLLNRHDLINQYHIEFEPKEGQAIVGSLFKYTGDCGHLGEGFAETEFDLVFVASDDKCYNPKSDTMSLRVKVSDISANTEEFLPPNVFTPNGDEFNPYFTMPNLPNNTCSDQFKEIKVFNRWGKEVYFSTERDFAWDGGHYPTGTYYYIIRFSSYSYKGIITILK
jgi:gliding motility-associated-like protein